MPLPPYPSRPRYFLSGYVRDLLHTGAIQAIGSDAFALLVLIAEAEEATGQKGPVLFWNSQLQAKLGLKSWKALATARERAVDGGYLHYESMGTRAQGSYWVDMPPTAKPAITCADDHNVSVITSETVGNGNDTPAITSQRDHNTQVIMVKTGGNPPEASPITSKNNDNASIIVNFDDNPPGSGAIIGEFDHNTHQQDPIIVKKYALPNNTYTPTHTHTPAHAREGASEEPSQPAAPQPTAVLRTWSPPKDAPPPLVEAIDKWQRFQLAQTGRPDSDVRIETMVNRRLSAGWSLARIISGIDLAIDRNAKTWLDGDDDYQAKPGRGSQYTGRAPPPAANSQRGDDTDIFG